jgi:DNA polymerase
LKKFGESNGVKDNNYYCYSDTDSVVGDTLIQTSIGKIKIQDLYNTEGEETMLANNSYVKKPSNNITTYSVSKDLKLNNNSIKYIMKHKVKKRMFKIKTPEQEVIITEDHSVMVLRNNILTEIKPKDIVKGDRIIRLIHD